MWFFIKNKKIVVDCFTDEPSAHNFFPIKSATAYYPYWWKQMPATFIREMEGVPLNLPTIKVCDGFINLYKNSFVLPCWTEIQIKTEDNKFHLMLAKTSLNKDYPFFEEHTPEQYGTAFNNKLHVKLVSPWFLKQNKKCDFAILPAIWSDPVNWSNYTILPGVIDFKYQSSTNVNLFLEPNKEKIFIEAGMPLVHFVPLTEYNVEFKCHLITTDELNKVIHNRYASFVGSYKKTKKFYQENEKRCPFNFTK